LYKLAHILIKAIEGQSKQQFLDSLTFMTHSEKVNQLVGPEAAWRTKKRKDISSSGHVFNTLEAALWCVAQTSSFKEAVLLAVNLGDDADTVGAVTGQIAGALYGLSAIPEKWRQKITWQHKICDKALQLYEVGNPPLLSEAL